MRPDTSSLHAALDIAYPDIARLSELEPAELLQLDITGHRANVNALLIQASEIVRNSAPTTTKAKRKNPGQET